MPWGPRAEAPHRRRRSPGADALPGLEQLVHLGRPRHRQDHARRRRRHGNDRHDQPRLCLCQHRRLLGGQSQRPNDTGGAPRDAQGKINANRRFPDMKALTDYIHHRGLKAGIYSSPGPSTCAGFTGCYRHEALDAQRFADWGFDFLKYDWCSYWTVAPNCDMPELKVPYERMYGELRKVNRDLVLNLCQYGQGDVWKWGDSVGNSWRTAGDLGGTFEDIPAPVPRRLRSVLRPRTAQVRRPRRLERSRLSAPGLSFQLERRHRRDAPDAQRAVQPRDPVVAGGAPLILGGDIARLDDFTLGLLCNDEVLDVDQDPLAVRAIEWPSKATWKSGPGTSRTAQGARPVQPRRRGDNGDGPLVGRGRCGQANGPRPLAAAGPGRV